jgi:uncharacterized protein (TIGR02284 family)
MLTTTETTETLNDLIAINNDRIRGYERAIGESKGVDADLKALFTGMIRESHTIRVALATEVQVLGGEIESGTTGSGKLYRAWMDVKAVFTGHDRHAILSNCEFGEDAAQKAYRDALETDDLPANIRTMLKLQQQTLKASHDEIRNLRDMAK